MNIAFAVVFVVLTCFSETARHGVFGLSASEIGGAVYAALFFGAVVILRGDLIYTVIRPRTALYGNACLNWTWPRSVLGLALGVLLWIVPMAYGVCMLEIGVVPNVSASALTLSFAMLFLVASAEGLFLREAVIKAHSANRFHVFAISTLAVFVFYVPHGVPNALIAAGAGVYFLTLRLVGTNVFVVAGVQAASMAMFTEVVTLDLAGGHIWSFAAYFMAASATLSICIYSLFSIDRGKLAYA